MHPLHDGRSRAAARRGDSPALLRRLDFEVLTTVRPNSPISQSPVQLLSLKLRVAEHPPITTKKESAPFFVRT
jgi:hypothetical protein